MRINKRLSQNIDWTLITLVAAICVIGDANIYSASKTISASGISSYFLRQTCWITAGFAIMLSLLFIDYHFLETTAYQIYLFSVLLLAAALLVGPEISHSKRWIRLGVFQLQPSEFAKLALIFALAKYFSSKTMAAGGYTIRDLKVPLTLVLLPAFLTVVEPDLGTALLVLFIGFSIVLFMGIRLTSLGILIAVAAGSMPFIWHYLKDYQKKRIMVFLNPSLDPLGAGYHITQSKIAIGSGKIWGKGFLKGTQTQLHFLPAQHTDFAFSVLAEEWGFIGSLVVLILLTLIILKALSIGYYSRDRLGAIVAFGVAAMIFWPTFINIGMVLGMLPVVGAPLPFISYGGSYLLAIMAGLGMLLSIKARRYPT